MPVVGSPALQRAAMMLALQHHCLHDRMSQTEIAAKAVAMDPHLTAAEKDLLTTYIGAVARALLAGHQHPPQVNTEVDINVVNLNIIGRDPLSPKSTLRVY